MAERARVVYQVLAHDALSHTAEFSVLVRHPPAPSFDLVLPVWSPGAYEIRDSAREVRELRASPEGDPRPLRVERVEKNRWRVHPDGSEVVDVRYSVYGRELTDDGFDVSDEHLYLNAPRCFPWVDGRADEPVELVLHLPPGWRAFVELPRLSESPPRFRAANFEELVDTPVECGRPQEVTFRAAGVPHTVLFCGLPGNFEAHRIEEDARKIVEAQVRYFGGSPLTSYTFLFHLADRRDGGLEHRASTSLVVERNSFRPAEAYERILTLLSHEYFHLYNVKRIRPKVLGPFDFSREVYTRLLWWMEGTTDYVSVLMLRRAGLFTPTKTLQKMGDIAARFYAMPGRAHRSLEEASLLAWIDLYRPFEESRNQSISYYDKGYLVSLALDLDLRHRTENAASLDTVFRKLWAEYGLPGRGLAEDELQPVIESATGLDVGEFFDRYVRGTADLDLARFAHHAGLKFGPAPKPANGEETADPGYLGIEFVNESGRVRVREVLEGSPARRAGISPADEIVSFDGARVLAEGFPDALKRYPPGSELTVDLYRRGVLRHLPLTTAKAPPAKYAFTPLESVTPLQKTIYGAWLDAPWEPAPPATPKTPPS